MLAAMHTSLYTTLLVIASVLTVWVVHFIVTGRPASGAYRSTYVLC